MTNSAASQVPGAAELVLALADDELCVGQNHSWWIAVGPFLEEDLAFTCIAQDELGHARSLYSLLVEGAVEGTAEGAAKDPAQGATQVDALAFQREFDQYRSAHLTELPCHDWTYALVRHYLYDTAEAVRWQALADSSWTELGSLARRVLLEERIHEHHASGLMTRLLVSQVGQERLGEALTELAPLAVGLFDLAVPDGELLAAGVLNLSLADQMQQWLSVVTKTLSPFGLEEFFEALTAAASATASAATSSDADAADPGRRGERSSYFAALHREMVEVFELEPSARW